MTAATVEVLIMAGGTGGHIFPGLALAEQLQNRGIGVHWLGAAGGMECRKVAEHGIPIDTIRISGVRGKGFAGWLFLPLRLTRAVQQAAACIDRRRPSCAVSFGGYAAGPGGLAARLRGIPLIVHEQNRVPGMTNRFLARIATRVMQAFPGTFGSGRASTCGNPVRAGLLAVPEPASRFAGRTGPCRLLVTGGSQGAGSLNRMVPRALGRLPEGQRPAVMHQAGRNRVPEVQTAYAEAGVQAEVFEFIEDMASAYGWADLAVCRAGALTVSELCAIGLGAVLVPFPHAVDDHQTRNASFMAEAGAARIAQERDMDEAGLAALLGGLLADRGELSLMAGRARAIGVRDAARQLADACQAYLPRSRPGGDSRPGGEQGHAD